MCEKPVTEDYFIHYFFCKERKVYSKKLIEVKDDLKLVVQFLNEFKKKGLTKENSYGIFSQESPFNLKLKYIKTNDIILNQF